MSEEKIAADLQKLENRNTDLGNRLMDVERQIELHKIRVYLFIGQCVLSGARSIANAIFAIVRQ